MSTNLESATTRPRRPRWIEGAERLDLAIYAAIARTPTPALDVAMSRLARAADYSRLSLTSAAVRMPLSRSFPSGHSATAFAFATGVGHVSRASAIPLHALAALVAYSRVHTGVHYPADVLAGGLIGTALAQLTTHMLARRRPRRVARVGRGRSRPAPSTDSSMELSFQQPGHARGRFSDRRRSTWPGGRTFGDNPATAAAGWASPRWYEIETIPG